MGDDGRAGERTSTTYLTNLGAGASAITQSPSPVAILPSGDRPGTTYELVVVQVASPTDTLAGAASMTAGAGANASDASLTTVTEEYRGSVTIAGPISYTDPTVAGETIRTVHFQTLTRYPALSDALAPVSTATNQSSSTPTPTMGPTTLSNGIVTSATMTPSSSSHSGSSDGVSTGALAGGIVGAFIGGALLALAAACLLFRRKPKSPRGGAYIEEKQHVYPWDAYIPQSADDGAIRRQVESLYSQIDMHVENYYSNTPASVAPSADLLGRVNSTHLPDHVTTMMASTSTPTPVIKHTFAWVILTQLSPAVKDEPSLLPPEFAHMPPQIVAEKDRKGGARENQATSQAYQYWRVLTAHLMYPRSGTRTTNLDNIPAAKDCVDILSAAFAPWSKGSTAARDHLTSVVKSASDTGLVLMSQPSSFAFPWTNEAQGSSTITTFPAFEKTTDERGNVLQQRQVMIRPKTEAISK